MVNDTEFNRSKIQKAAAVNKIGFVGWNPATTMKNKMINGIMNIKYRPIFLQYVFRIALKLIFNDLHFL
jgi:hypothetical protein